MEVEEKKVRLNKTQESALKIMLTHVFTLLFGGSRSGKTFIIILFMLVRALKRKSRHVILRYRFSHVKTSIVYDTFPKVCNLFKISYNLNKSDWFVTLENGSEIWFGGLDDKERTEKILGNEYSTIFLNESSQISYDSFTIVKTRLAENSGLPLRMICDENPPAKSHWSYQVFILKHDPEVLDISVPLPDAEDYASMQINPNDNIINIPEAYLKILNSLPKSKRERFLDGEFADFVKGALWNKDMIKHVPVSPKLVDIVVAIDPSVTEKSTSDPTGIIVSGKDLEGNGYVLEDLSGIYSPKGWAETAVNAFHRYNADCIVAERNQGGDMVKHTIKTVDKYIRVELVWAAKGKRKRAEPVSALYEDGIIFHVGMFPDLEFQMVSYTGEEGEKSPNNFDAMVWGFNYLFPLKGVFEAFY